MIAALALATAPVLSALDAEARFAQDAKRIGQWTAFRKWSAPDAVMFTPRAVWAQQFLKGMRDPPNAISWRPAQSFVSCDGRTAVNIGPWFKQDGSVGGSFTTIWQLSKRGWRWVYDGGGPPLHSVLQGKALEHRAACTGKAAGRSLIAALAVADERGTLYPSDSGRGESADKTLAWDWIARKNAKRRFRVYQWTGQAYQEVIHGDVPAHDHR